MIAKNTIILTDIIVKLGLEERFDVAWRSAQHGQVHEHMRSEFEIEERFEQVRTKVGQILPSLQSPEAETPLC